MPVSGIDPGFSSGWFGAGQAQQQEQGGQIAQALELAKMEMDKAQMAHQQNMDTVNQNLIAAHANYLNTMADTQKQYRADQQQTAAEKVKNDDIQKLITSGDRSYNIAGNDFPSSYAALKAKYPDIYEELASSKLGQLQAIQNQKPPVMPGAGIPQAPQMQPGEAMPPQAMTIPGMQNMPGGGMVGLPPEMQHAPGPAMPPPQAGGMPGMAGGPPPMPQAPPQTFGPAAVQPSMSPAGLQPTPLTEDALHGAQSPQFLAARAKEAAKAQNDRIRADAYTTGQEARQTLADAALGKNDILSKMADARGQDAETRRMQLKTDLPGMYTHADEIEARMGIQQQLADSLGTFRTVIGAARTQDSATKAKNSAMAVKIWQGISKQAAQTDKLAEQTRGLSTIAQDALQKALADQEEANAAVAKNPDDAGAGMTLASTTRRVGQLRQQFESIKAQAAAKQSAADHYNALSGELYQKLGDAGYVDQTDGKGTANPSRATTTLPSVSVNPPNSAQSDFSGRKITPVAPQIPTITGDADFNKLPSGTIFIGPDGKRRRKP